MVKEQNKEDTDDEDILIEWPQVVMGLYLVRKNAKRILQDGKFLYDNNKFQNSIPLFIISIEETLKSHEMSIKFRKKQSLSSNDWSKLQQHQHKLKYVSNFVIENMESIDDETTKSILGELGKDENLFKKRNEMISLNKAEKGIKSHYQKLKEFCLYQNWNREFCEWDEFDTLSSQQKEDLSYYMMKKAEIELIQLDMSIEMAVYVIRRDDFMIKDLEFPSYNELREPKDFETKDSDVDLDHFKFYRGLKILESLIIKKAFAIIDQIMTHATMKNFLKILSIDNSKNWYPHPMIKSLFLATGALREGNKDGNYAGYADDSDQTHEGKPMMYCVSIISKKNKIFKIETIMINGVEYSVNDKIIEQIIKTEFIIESQLGKDISLEKTHEAYSKINLKIRKLRDNEIVPAIINAISMINNGTYDGIPEEIKEKVKLVTKKNWDDQEPEIRTLIGTSLSSKIIKDENTILMTGAYDPLEKFKVRGMIYDVIVNRNKIGMGTG